MMPYKIGQVAKFHTTLPGEDPSQLYVVLQIIEDVERPRADIRALGLGNSFIPINTVLLTDLEIVETDTSDLVGKNVTINKADYSQVTGKVAKVSKQNIKLDLTKGVKGVETNVRLTILDKNGKEHTGTLFVNKP